MTDPEESGNLTYAVCPQCLRFINEPQQPHELVGDHNESRHDGVDVAIVIEDDCADLADLLDHAIEILADSDGEVVTDDQFHKLVQKFRCGDLPMFVSASRWEDILDAAVHEDAIRKFGQYGNLPSPDEWTISSKR